MSTPARRLNPTTPAAVRLIVAVLLVSVAVGLYSSLVELVNGVVRTVVHGQGPSLLVSVLSAAWSAVLALVTLLVARGVARGRQIAQVVVLAVLALRALQATWRLLFTPNAVAGSVVELVVVGVLVALLTGRAARRYFGRDARR